MSDQVVTVTVKGVGDFSDVVSNVGSVQKALTKLKLPDKLGDNLNKNITAFYKEYDKYQQKIAGGLKTQGDYNQVEKSLNTMRNLYQAIGADAQKLLKLDMKDLLNLDTGEFKKISDDITNIMKEIGSFKIDMSPFTKATAEIRNVTKNSKISGDGGLLNQIIGSINTGQIAEAKKQLQELQNYANKVAPRTTASGERMPGTLSTEKYQQLTNAIGIMTGAVSQAEAAMNPLIQKQNDLQRELEETKQKAVNGIEKEFKGYNEASQDVERVTDSLKKMHQEEFSFNREAQNIDRQIQSYFGLSQMIRKVGDIARDAFSTVKELDKAMTETAVVTNFSVGDMWEMLPTYTAQANQLGSTIKDVYDAATLYYQQGLNTNQAMSLANETLKMARIAGLDAADATNMMTAALRGFNMEINQQSAQKINDIYSELAAITASDTKEIGSAMERTASIANSANMEFATTSAFLAQMIETTREAPENLGTAMKTIVARFQEMKQDPTKLIDSEGVAMDANKVDKALKTIGVNLMNTKGEFRDLDDVFLDIASRWDTLSQGQQRYIATIAAGSRQQSRFIAMMSNYERTMELVDAANNSAGASQRQFEKTLDSMGAKLNMLKNAWDQFTMGLMNNQILKFGVDALTEGFTIVNKLIDALSKLGKPFGLEGLNKSLLTLVTTLGMLNFGKKASRGLVMGGVGWWKGETSLAGGFASGWKGSGQTGLLKNNNSETQAQAQGVKDGRAYSLGFQKGQLSIDPTKKFLQNASSAYAQLGKKAIGWDTIQSNKANLQKTTFNFGPLPVDSIIEQLLPKKSITDEIRYQLQQSINDAGGDLSKGMGIFQSATGLRLDADKMYDPAVQRNYDNFVKGLDKAQGLTNFTNNLASAGVALTNFGMLLQNTPLEPFGNLIATIGNGLLSLAPTIAKATNTFAIGMGQVMAAEGGAATTTALLAGGFKALTTAMLESPLFWIAAAILAVVAAVKVADWAIETNAEKLEKAEDAAAAASEAYDSAKQETSELADSIAKIQETDSAFDNLVAGTAEFNEQLVTANEQILALIDKYPMLMEGGYVSTDKNGLMHISDEGFKAVKEYQKQIQANASAMNLIQTADLNALENMQKAEALRTKVNGSRRGEMTESEAKEHEKNLRDADLLEQRAKAEVDLARSNAIRTALSGKELRDTEALTAVYTNLYDEKRKAAETEVNALGAHDIRQRYADYHGYTYDRSTKKIKDVEGNEIDYDDKALKDEVIEQTVLLDFEENANSLDDVLTSVNNKFKQGLKGDFGDASKFISDVLSSNIDTNQDLLQEVINNPKQLQELTNSLTEKEIAAVLGVSESEVSANVEQYKKEFENKILDNAKNISEANADANGKLAAMIAQSQGKTAGEVSIDKTVQSGLIAQVEKLSSQQRNTLLKVGEILQSSVGADSMSTFIKGMTDIYDTGQEQLINTAQDWADDINWESAIDRLRGYNEAINMTTENTEHLGEAGVTQMNNLGKAMLQSTDEANLLGQAFEEFYNSSDWQEMSENMDKFVDSSGQLNAAAVMDMADECHSLNNLLDSGAISAGGVAAALNALGSDGDLVLSDLNAHVLELLSTFGQLDDIIASSHRNIENFDWGIDTGEAEDFVKESAEKWNELYKNGEYGNPQLEAYAKWIMGEEKYTSLLADKHGDLEATMAEVSKSVNLYSDGFEKAWDKLAQGSWENVNFSDDLKDLGISVSFDENGDWNFDPGKATTEQLQQWLQQALQVGPEMAQAMIEDWSNYSPDFRAERQKNDFNAGLESYVKERTGADGGVAITTSELQTIASATGQTLDEVRSAIVDTANISESQLHELENINSNTGEYIMDGAELNRQLSTAEGLKGQNSWLAQYKHNDTEGTVDIGAAMAAAVERGYTAAQAKQMAYESYTNAQQQGKDYYYKDQLLKADEFKSFDEFAARLEEIDQNQQWVTVGQTMADAFIARLDAHDREEEQKEKESSLNRTQDNKPEPNPRTKETGGLSTSERDKQSAEKSREIQQDQANKIAEGIKGVASWVSDHAKADVSSSERINQKNGETAQRASEKTQTAANDTSNAANETSVAAGETTNAATSLNTAATNLNSAATALNAAAMKMTNSSSGSLGSMGQISQPQQKPSIAPTVQQGATTVQKVVTEAIGTDEVQAKIQQVKDTANEGADLKVGAIVDKSVQAAQTAVQGLQNVASKSTNTKVGATVGGNKEASNLNATLGKLQNKTVTVNVRINGESRIASLKNEISSLHDKSVTITTYKKTIKTGDTGATGRNNVIKHYSLPTLGSLAKGTRYGRLGPKGKGGLTLTGEKGYEIAWIPSESRSMILGAEGPQMINLPSDAVIYTHEQSEDILKKKQTIDAGSHSKRKRGGGSSGGSGSSKSSKKSSKKSKSSKKGDSSAPNNWSIEEVVRFDIDRKLETLASKIKKATDDIDKKLGKIGLKASGIAKDTQAQVKNLQAVKNYNDNLVKSYQKDLNKLDTGGYNTKISYETGSGKKKKSKEETVNLSSYIYRDGNGDYQINKNAIAKAGSKAKQEAIFKAAESALNPLVSGLQKAKDAAADAQKQMDELGKKVSETFYQWENEITEVYNLTQRISHDESLRARFSSQVALQLSKLKAGFGDTAQSIDLMHRALERDNKVLLEQIENQQKMIGARQRELNAALSAQDELDELNRLRAKSYDTAATKNATIEWATDNYQGARLGRNYLNNVRQDRDGSLRYDIDWARFERDRKADPYNKNTYEAIKKYLDELNSATDEFNKSIQEQTDLIKETYDALREYQDYVADFEDTLLKGFEEEIENNIENSKKISESISNTLKDLLDQVKRKLDERRQQEDNRKTEDDISRKQQRLAMLRADTSGSHAAEIAQLESEIADSQQSYQRTLEDQLLDKLQQQGDEAAKQRERQIEIAQAQLDVATSGNTAIVDMWLRNPEAYKEEIKKAWLEAQGYDEKGEAGQYILANQFESEFANLITAIDQSGFANGFKAVSDDTSTLVSLLTQLTEGRNALTDSLSKAAGALQDVENRDTQSFELGKRTQLSAAEWKKEGQTASSLKNWGYTFDELKKSGFTNTELKNAGFGVNDFKAGGVTNAKDLKASGFTAANLKNSGYTFKDLLDASFSGADLKGAGFGAQDFKQNNVAYNTAKSAGFDLNTLSNAGYSEATAAIKAAQAKAAAEARAKAEKQQKYNNYISYLRSVKKLKPAKVKSSHVNQLFRLGAAAGYGKASVLLHLVGGAGGSDPFSWKNIFRAIIDADGISRYNLVKTWPNGNGTLAEAIKSLGNPDTYSEIKKHRNYKTATALKFATGGLANYTGPAWLDGTPSKPELVLNATDTKNFIALKDVLAHAMGSTNEINNSYGGNATYEININVDHLNNDYDVDKVVERVKKKIVQDAGYRNVTQVRKFR